MVLRPTMSGYQKSCFVGSLRLCGLLGLQALEVPVGPAHGVRGILRRDLGAGFRGPVLVTLRGSDGVRAGIP